MKFALVVMFSFFAIICPLSAHALSKAEFIDMAIKTGPEYRSQLKCDARLPLMLPINENGALLKSLSEEENELFEWRKQFTAKLSKKEHSCRVLRLSQYVLFSISIFECNAIAPQYNFVYKGTSEPKLPAELVQLADSHRITGSRLFKADGHSLSDGFDNRPLSKEEIDKIEDFYAAAAAPIRAGVDYEYKIDGGLNRCAPNDVGYSGQSWCRDSE